MSTKISLPELKSLCKDNNIKGYSKLKKDEIIDLLKKNKVDIKKVSERTEIDDITEKISNIGIKQKENEEINDEFKNEIIKYFVFNDDKSNKFWEIKYEDNNEDKRKYIVRYGKVDTTGSRSKPKMDTLTNINKIIDNKTKKGYSIVEVDIKKRI